MKDLICLYVTYLITFEMLAIIARNAVCTARKGISPCLSAIDFP